MKPQQHYPALRAALALMIACAAGAAAAAGDDALTAVDATGMVRTVTPTGVIDTTSPFFQSLGTNGRSCFTCHRPETAWSVTPASVQARFHASAGTDPIFRTTTVPIRRLPTCPPSMRASARTACC